MKNPEKFVWMSIVAPLKRNKYKYFERFNTIELRATFEDIPKFIDKLEYINNKIANIIFYQQNEEVGNLVKLFYKKGDNADNDIQFNKYIEGGFEELKKNIGNVFGYGKRLYFLMTYGLFVDLARLKVNFGSETIDMTPEGGNKEQIEAFNRTVRTILLEANTKGENFANYENAFQQFRPHKVQFEKETNFKSNDDFLEVVDAEIDGILKFYSFSKDNVFYKRMNTINFQHLGKEIGEPADYKDIFNYLYRGREIRYDIYPIDIDEHAKIINIENVLEFLRWLKDVKAQRLWNRFGVFLTDRGVRAVQLLFEQWHILDENGQLNLPERGKTPLFAIIKAISMSPGLINSDIKHPELLRRFNEVLGTKFREVRTDQPKFSGIYDDCIRAIKSSKG